MPEFPSNTEPHENDSEEETLKKILKILNDAKDGTAPLQVSTTSTPA